MLSTYSTDYAESFKENRRYMGYAPEGEEEDDQPSSRKGSEFRSQLDAEFQKALLHQAQMNITMGNRPSIDDIRIDDIVQANQVMKNVSQQKVEKPPAKVEKPPATKQAAPAAKPPAAKPPVMKSEAGTNTEGRLPPISKEDLVFRENKPALPKKQENANPPQNKQEPAPAPVKKQDTTPAPQNKQETVQSPVKKQESTTTTPKTQGNITTTTTKSQGNIATTAKTQENKTTTKINKEKILVEDDDTRLRNFIEIMGLNADDVNKTS
ncbi:hypothetical protein TVAG_387960 [Trichomonas vaginalis G3]|uniref:Uncharacterized protein n=1 Tax=Trichomonas vaginalis (strain ATCC PRA-98 / G3) TaxID=412133 RepID=A2E123_TRIV3|nr:hypothetical protein TVAGG3_0330620 [Trichomonas vaginalis G3]EAY13655.1 hypothetical protein TVAG_387960 [Trichomonas vaginalis G3]KAI5529929.1 hypothetical protein TVAGG3_0330620 [Trichomonas vaginalis G3]|eukprot:XP_001325878.1 hypothetical protein [Trichomonas vaginalis G3]